jgi:tRNA (adenine57-N1/adenine58-N1)-methyltransferase catalytic subunit
LKKLELQQWVTFKARDIAAGFDETDVDALFLDVREPEQYLQQSYAALVNGGFFGALVPTTNQVSELIGGLQVNYFGDIQVEELLLRQYKPVAQRLRPVDIMTAHTGYLVFARKIVPTGAGVEPEEAAVPPLAADGFAHLGGAEEA